MAAQFDPHRIFESISSLMGFVSTVAATGLVCGLIARRYYLVPALLLLWLVWMWFIHFSAWDGCRMKNTGKTCGIGRRISGCQARHWR